MVSNQLKQFPSYLITISSATCNDEKIQIINNTTPHLYKVWNMTAKEDSYTYNNINSY